MPRFVNLLTGDLVSTAYKVMYSTMVGTEVLREIGEVEFIIKAAKKLLHQERLLIAVRNPYARLASFFADKLRRDLEREDGGWQFSQVIFFSLVNVTADDSFETIRSRLGSISFEAFVDYLPQVRMNGHLRPQADLLRAGDLDLVSHSTAFQVETDLQRLWAHLGIRRPQRKNATFSHFDPAILSQQRLDLINEVYLSDFESFGYERC